MSSIGLEEYKEIFLENDMNGAMMLEANYDDLAEIGIDSRLHQVKILTLFKRKYSRNEPALRFACTSLMIVCLACLYMLLEQGNIALKSFFYHSNSNRILYSA